MSISEVEIVERPAHRNPSKYPVDEVVETAQTGKAVRFALNGTSVQAVRSAISWSFRRRKITDLIARVHNPKDGTLIVWAEKRA
jgi:hypothetical protein